MKICEVKAAPTIGNSPSEITLELLVDADVTLTVILLDADRQPVDVTGQTVDFDVYDYYGGTQQLTKSMSLVDAANGKVQVELTPIELDTLLAVSTSLVYEIVRTYATSKTAVHVRGDLVLVQ